MLPADGILRAAARWLRLLEHSTFQQAEAIIRSHSAFTDLSITQYATALDWLFAIELVEERAHGIRLAPTAHGLSHSQLDELLFAKTLESANPAWLQDADVLVRDVTELPQDASDVAHALGLGEGAAFLGVRQAQGRIDLALRAQIGNAGELALVDMLELRWPGSTKHVALEHDGLGYDLDFSPPGMNWHIEVKTTTRRGRLAIYLSRHEYEVGLLDPAWQLVVVGLDGEERLGCVATVLNDHLRSRAPRDIPDGGSWQSARFELAQHDLRPGLRFLNNSLNPTDEASVLFRGTATMPAGFGWMPDQ